MNKKELWLCGELVHPFMHRPFNVCDMQFHTLDEISYVIYSYLNGGQNLILLSLHYKKHKLDKLDIGHLLIVCRITKYMGQ